MEMFLWLLLFYIAGSITGYYLMKTYTIGSTIVALCDYGVIKHRKDKDGNLVIIKLNGDDFG